MGGGVLGVFNARCSLNPSLLDSRYTVAKKGKKDGYKNGTKVAIKDLNLSVLLNIFVQKGIVKEAIKVCYDIFYFQSYLLII